MPNYFNDVKAFHDKFGLVTPDTFSRLAQDLHKFRVNFLIEEFTEYVDSVKANDIGTAIDSLIDLVYITCGTAIYHGITSEEWIDITTDEDDLHGVEDLVFVTEDEPVHTKPTFLTPEINVKFTKHLEHLIKLYDWTFGTIPDKLNEGDVKSFLGAIYNSTLAGATYMGLSQECWDEMWNDVQRANMSKERVLRAEDSKRGSTYDVRKPVGWIPPRTEEILAKYL